MQLHMPKVILNKLLTLKIERVMYVFFKEKKIDQEMYKELLFSSFFFF